MLHGGSDNSDNEEDNIGWMRKMMLKVIGDRVLGDKWTKVMGCSGIMAMEVKRETQVIEDKETKDIVAAAGRKVLGSYMDYFRWVRGYNFNFQFF